MPLREIIAHEIRAHGPIPFSRYMELCLYHPTHGYYSRNATQFGKAGDFFTSSDVHAVFGRLLARQFDEMWRALDSPPQIVIRELGPGRGLFAQDVLDWSQKKFPAFFTAMTYELIERSSALRARIEQTLQRHIKSGKVFVETDSNIAAPRQHSTSQPSTPTILFANEFFDALPVEIVSTKGTLHIDLREDRLTETWLPSAPNQLEFLDRYSVHPEDYDLANYERLEIPLAAQQSLVHALQNIERGFAIAIDYGYTRAEQLAGRHRGTLKAIRQHSVSNNPYEAPGEQDLTADVNFTALAAVAENLGWNPEKLITQSQFLLGIGETNQFADAFEDCRLPQERAKVALQLKHLVTPAGMGESFHVLVASKRVDLVKTSKLAGLSFGRR